MPNLFNDDDLIIDLDDDLIIVPPKKHNELENLGYEESGHTGFTPSILSLLGGVDSETTNANFYIIGNVNNVAKKMTLADLLTRVIKTADELPSDLQEGQYLFQKTSGNNYQLYKVGANSELIAIRPQTSADNVLETNEKKVMTADERTKLAEIEAKAQVNKLDGVKVNGTRLQNEYAVANPQPTSETFANGIYYTRSGEGTEQSPYVYTRAITYDVSATYYVDTKIVNIIMPTDVGADITYNATTGVLSLVDKNGNVLGSVDLPLELLIQSGYYDSTNREIVLVLANNTPQVPSQIRIPVGDLVDVYTGDNVNVEVDANNVIKFTQAFLTRIATIETSLTTFQAKAIEKSWAGVTSISFTQDEYGKIENGAMVIVTYTSDNTKHTFVPYKKDSNGITLLNDEEFSKTVPLTYTKLTDLPNYDTLQYDPNETYYDYEAGTGYYIATFPPALFDIFKANLYIGATFDKPKVYKKQLTINTSYSGTISDYELLLNSKQDALVSGTNIKTINGVSILGSGDMVINSDLYIEKTYAELKALRDNSQLTKGMQYRITDYQCTTVQAETQSAGNQFDIIVIADDVNKLNENARACLHSGDTYFATSNLNSWQLKYCLDNDTTKFEWADDTNGKGVIYYMKDEFNNECPYDFKNIMFKRYKVTATDTGIDALTSYSSNRFGAKSVKNSSIFYPLNSTIDENTYTYYYTFSGNSGEAKDISLNNADNLCFNNKIRELNVEKNYKKILTLNNIVLYSPNNSVNKIQDNTFGYNCFSITLADDNINNIFESNCYGIIGLLYCKYNKFAKGCHDIILDWYNESNTFDTNVSSVILVKYCYHIKIDEGCKYLYIDSVDTSVSSSNRLQNVHICMGVSGSSSVNKLNIEVADRGLAYETTYRANNSTEVLV